MYAAKNSKIWTFWPVIQPINHINRDIDQNIQKLLIFAVFATYIASILNFANLQRLQNLQN